MSIDLGQAIVTIGADMTGLTSSLSQATSLLGGFGGIASAALVGVGVASLKAAGDFQSSVTTLVTGAGESVKNIDMIKQGLLAMSVSTATPVKNLVDGLYMIESAGFHGAAGLQVLQAAAEGAKVGNADLGTVAKGLTTLLTDYASKNYTAAQATNGMIATVAAGKMHMQDLAGSMGTLLPLASSLGVSFPQVAGALAVMTNAGMSAQRASMNLANAIRSLSAPSATAQTAMQSVGLSAQQLKDTLSTQGLTGAIQLIEDHVGKKFPAGSVQAVQAFKDIMGGATGYNVALMLGGKNMAAYETNVKNITNAMNDGKTSVTGWTQVQGDFNFKMGQAQQATNALMISIGTALLPAVTNLVSAIIPLITHAGDLITVWNRWKPVIEATAIALAVFFTPALIKAGIEAVLSAAKIVADFVASLILTGTEGWAAAAKLIPFIASLVETGIQAVIAGAKMTASLIPAIISMAAEGLMAAATAIPGLIAGFIAWATTAGAAAIATIAATWPILVIIAAIVALIAVIVLLYTHWGQVTAFMQSVWQSFTSWLSTAWHNLENWAAGLGNAALQWGKNLIQGFINGIWSMLSAVGNAASSVASTVASYLGFHSPAKQGPGATADTWAPNLVKMFNTGLQQGQPALNATLNTMLAPHVYPSSTTSSVASASASGGGSQTLVLAIDGREFATAVVPHMGNAQHRYIQLKTGVR